MNNECSDMAPGGTVRDKSRHVFCVRTFLCMVLLSFTAAGIRIYRLGDWSFWYDEMYTLRDASYVPGWHRPIQFVLTQLAFDIFGEGEWSARFFPAIAGILSVPTFYFLIKRIANTQVALINGLLVTLSPWHLFHSQAARFYATVFLFSGVSVFLFFDGVQRSSKKIILLAVFFALLAFFTHPTAAMLIPAYAVFIFIFLLQRYRYTIEKQFILLMSVGSLIVCIVLGPYVYQILLQWFRQNQGDLGPYSLPHLLGAIVYNIGLAVAILAGFSLLALLKNKEAVGYFFLCCFGVPLVFICFASPFLRLRPDYVFFVMPGAFFLAADGSARIISSLKKNQPILAGGVLTVIALSSLPSLVSHYVDGDRFMEREAAAFVSSRRVLGDVVLSPSPGVFEYYGRGEAAQINMDKAALDRFIEKGQRVWLIAYYDRGGMSRGIHADVRKWIYDYCRLVKELIPRRFDYHLNGIQIFLYAP